MFDDIGGKIRTLAVLLCVIGVIASVLVGGMILFAGNNAATIITGLLVVILGCLASWGASLLVFGFGKSVENSQLIADRLSAIEQQGRRLSTLLAAQQPAERQVENPAQQTAPTAVERSAPQRMPNPVKSWVCPQCGAQNRASVFCSGCGLYRKAGT